MKIRHLHLQTARLDALRTFYADVFDRQPRPLNDGFAIEFGRTTVEFSHVSSAEPRYHFAVNVPNQRFRETADRLADRTTLLSAGGDTEFYFEAMHADAVYCRDPAGNIVELIARRNLTTPDEDSHRNSFLEVSEIGLPVSDVVRFASAFDAKLGVTPHVPGSESFAAVGDDHGLFILTATGRDWFPTDDPAALYPVTVTIDRPLPEPYRVPEHPYTIAGTSKST